MPDAAQAALSRIVLELAREPGHPEGDARERYIIVAPLTAEGRLNAEAWRHVRDHCRIARESVGEETSLGHLVHGPGGRWFLQFDLTQDRPDETGFRFETEKFEAGEYVSIERDEETHVFRVTAATPI